MNPVTYAQTKPRPDRRRTAVDFPVSATVSEVLSLEAPKVYKCVVIHERHDGNRVRTVHRFSRAKDAHSHARASLHIGGRPR
jgi:hypothetical protein